MSQSTFLICVEAPISNYRWRNIDLLNVHTLEYLE